MEYMNIEVEIKVKIDSLGQKKGSGTFFAIRK